MQGKEAIMTQISPETVYDNLDLLETVDVITSAYYRHLAQDVLADASININLRLAIADRLNDANHLLGMLTVGKDDSY
jgi:hypothetical protein